MNNTVRVIMQKSNKYAVSMMILLGVLFFFIPGQWVCLVDDSMVYLEGRGEGVLPVYPIFLNLFRRILGEQYFLNGVVTVQSVLAIICTLLFVISLRNRFELQGWECILLYVASMLPFSIYLPEGEITHYIMTEGLTYSLFYIYYLFLLNFVLDRKYKSGIGLLVMTLFLMLIRRQLMMLLITTFVAFIYVTVRKINNKKTVIKILSLSIGLAVVAGGLFINGLRTQMINNSQFTTVLMSRGFYEADRKDVDLFQDEMMRDIFDRTYELADSEGKLYTHAASGLYMWKDLVYDRMKGFALQAIEEYDALHPGDRVRDQDSIVQELGMKILFKHFDRYLYHTIRLVIPSFISTVFFQVESVYFLCHFITLFLYVFAVAGCVLVYRGKRDRKCVEFMASVLCSLVIMVVSANLLFIGLQRYMVYEMGIFYCALYLLCKEILAVLQQKRRI